MRVYVHIRIYKILVRGRLMEKKERREEERRRERDFMRIESREYIVTF
jgi:hypothetical protein